MEFYELQTIINGYRLQLWPISKMSACRKTEITSQAFWAIFIGMCIEVVLEGIHKYTHFQDIHISNANEIDPHPKQIDQETWHFVVVLGVLCLSRTTIIGRIHMHRYKWNVGIVFEHSGTSNVTIFFLHSCWVEFSVRFYVTHHHIWNSKKISMSGSEIRYYFFWRRGKKCNRWANSSYRLFTHHMEPNDISLFYSWIEKQFQLFISFESRNKLETSVSFRIFDHDTAVKTAKIAHNGCESWLVDEMSERDGGRERDIVDRVWFWTSFIKASITSISCLCDVAYSESFCKYVWTVFFFICSMPLVVFILLDSLWNALECHYTLDERHTTYTYTHTHT